MKSDNDPMLESDHLDQLLEEPAAAQPVVVVEYRSRGVPSWVFFPLLFLIPLGAIVVYHRMVFERYRVQAAEERSLIVRDLSVDRAPPPLVRPDPPPAGLLVESRTVAASNGSAASVASPDGKPPVDLAGPMAQGLIPAVPAGAPPAIALSEPTAQPNVSSPAGPLPAGGTVGPHTGEGAQPAAAALAPGPATLDRPAGSPEKSAKITMRSILPNPFANELDAPAPPAPGEKGVSVPAASGEPGAATRKADPTPMAVAATTEPVLAPLPTKEEALREIEEEAARKQAELVARADGKSAELRAQRLEEQQRFRDELRELIQTQGNQAGPEIDKLAKRYGYEFDPIKFAQANQVWRYARRTQTEKVRMIRSLDLPETVILNFLSDDIFSTMLKRNGPRNQSEVRVLAAKQLLRYALPKAVSGQVPANPAASPGRSQAPVRKAAGPASR